MDSNRWKKISQILDVALSYPDEKRTTYILDMCGNDADLLKEISELLASLNDSIKSDTSIDKHIENNVALIYSEFDDGPQHDSVTYLTGQTIGQWNLLKLIGSGGMGSVYKAERTGEGGVHQTGALKIIHKSLVTSSHIERFKLEQQILSRLEHPNIARFIDSGITTDGVPYMVMEFVEGKPILDHCNYLQLTLDQRLELFKTVCRTVQYAHKSLVVHRDLKSENILVTPDGQVKILDFGIAKLLDPTLYDYSRIETQTGLRLLSLEYASPEQVRGEPVTTSTDLYSLGILLYKLLVGLHPFDVDDLSYRELETMILENDSPMPGTRYLNIADNEMKKAIAQKRGAEPAGLIKKVKGDLDAIVQKSLQKEPERRYISVEALVADLERHQAAQPILARSDTYGYRLRKLLYRRRLAVTAISLVLFVLMAGIIATLWQADQANQNARQAELQAQRAGQVTDFLVELFESNDPAVAQGSEITVDDLLAKGVEKAREPGLDTDLQMNMLATLGRVYLSLGEYQESIDLLQQALSMAERDQSPEQLLQAADIQTNLGLNFRFTGNLNAADSLLHIAFENRKNILGEHHPLTISSMDDWAAVQVYKFHDIELADSLFQDVLNRRRVVLDSQHEDLAKSLNNLGYIKIRKGEFEEALNLYEEASDIYRAALGEYHPSTLHVMSSIAYLYHKLGDLERSELVRRETIEIRREVLGENHPHLAMSYHYLAELLLDAGRADEALDNSLKAVTIMQATGTTQPAYPDALVLLAKLYHRTANFSLAGETYNSASVSCMEMRGIESPTCSLLIFSATEFFIEQKQYQRAYEILLPVYESLQEIYKPGHEKRQKLDEMFVLLTEN